MNDQKIEELLKKSLNENEEVWTLTTQVTTHEKLLHQLEPYAQPKVDLNSHSSSPKKDNLHLRILLLVLGVISFTIGLRVWLR